METKLATKTEFAAICGVSKARVSQWISEGKIGANELAGHGRAAKIKVEAAIEKLKLRLDPAQRIGNGLGTKLSSRIPEADDSENDVLDRKLKTTRLQIAEAQNRRLQEDEKVRKGIYILAADASEGAGHLAAKIIQELEQGVVEFARETAALHKLPERDVLHLVRSRFREVRAKIAANLASQAAELPQFKEEEPEVPEVEYDRNKN